MAKDEIKEECISAKLFSPSADETKDNAKRELLTINLRYYSNKAMSIVERFVGFTWMQHQLLDAFLIRLKEKWNFL